MLPPTLLPMCPYTTHATLPQHDQQDMQEQVAMNNIEQFSTVERYMNGCKIGKKDG